jgi:hypothetical protein
VGEEQLGSRSLHKEVSRFDRSIPLDAHGQDPHLRALGDALLAFMAAGTLQGSRISQLLTNLILECAFNVWIHRLHPDIALDLYAEDVSIA